MIEKVVSNHNMQMEKEKQELGKKEHDFNVAKYNNLRG